MFTHHSTGARRIRAFAVGATMLLCGGSLFFGREKAIYADDSVTVVRVEEDWELVIGEPDADLHAPQITTVISPTSDLESVYAALDLNHESLPDFVAGGMQLQVWHDERPIVAKISPNTDVLNFHGERISWTQSMRMEGDGLIFEITNGNSTTWGTFGGEGYLKAAVVANLPNLNGYNPAVSVKNSGAGFAGNRVKSLVLKQVRFYTAEGQWYFDANPRVAQ